MATPAPKQTLTARIPIWSAGTRTDRHGNAYEFSADDLAATAAAYSPGIFRAPWVKGHPQMADPAYGQAKALQWDGKLLWADSHQVDPEFAEEVRAGKWLNISPSFFPPNHKDNPVPGIWYLKNIGWLGAAAPANKELPPPEFAAADDGTINCGPGPKATLAEFGAAERWAWGDLAEWMRRLREWVIDKHDVEEADRAVPDYIIRTVETAAKAADDMPGQLKAEFTESTTEAQETTMPNTAPNAQQAAEFAEREQRLQQQEAEFAEREQRLQQQEAEQHQAQCAEFAEGLVKKHNLVPRLKSSIAALLAATPVQNDQVAEFAEGDQQKKVPVGQLLREVLEEVANPNNLVPVGEFAAPEDQDEEAAEFAAPDGYQVPKAAADLQRKAQAYADKHEVDFITAYKAVGGK